MAQKKLQRFADIKTFKNVLEYPENMQGNWQTLFNNNNPIVLELACGRGEYTVGLSVLYPQKNFLHKIKMAPVTTQENLKREIGVRSLTLAILNITAGSGIFVIPAIIAEGLGATAILAYFVCGVLIFLIGLCFAEVGSNNQPKMKQLNNENRILF